MGASALTAQSAAARCPAAARPRPVERRRAAQYGIVVNEVKDTATAPLRAVRLAAEYFQAAGNQEKQDAVLARLKDLQNTSTEPVVHVMTATVLMQTENYGDALRVLRSGGDNLEWCGGLAAPGARGGHAVVL